MTGNAESSDAGDLPPLPGFGAEDQGAPSPAKADDAGFGGPGGFGDEPEAVSDEPAPLGAGAGDLFPDSDDDDDDVEPGIAPPKTEAGIARAQASSERIKNDKDEFLGRTFGGYELVETIGHGGMGTVYKGRQVSLDRIVAVKLLLPALVNNDEFIRRFEREAKSIARISHPNIVGVLDFGVSEDGVYYMVIEFVQGTSLSAMIAEKLMMSLEEYLPILSQCLAGLDHVSRHGVIHRDIKPDNILVDDTGVAKLADFGLAKDVSQDNNDTDLTAVGSAMGTPAYMSPEQCMGRPLDVRSDVYAFGVTSYLALTGEKPFKGNSGFEVMTKQREYVPPAPHELNPQINKEVSKLIMRMLAKKPQDRFKDADECRQAWLALGEGLGVIVPTNMRSGEWHVHDGMGSDASIPVPVDPVPGAVPAAPLDDPFSHVDADAAPPIVPSDRHAASSQRVRRASTGPITNQPPPPLPPGANPAAPPPVAPNPVGTNPPPPVPPGAVAPDMRTAPGTASSDVRRATGFDDSADMRTCPQCHAQSKITYSRCQNCGFDFSQQNTGSVDEQIARADTYVAQGKLKEAVTLFKKLADQTDDRKLRSVIRSKERGARKALEDKVFDRVSQKSNELLNQGNLKGSAEYIEREMQAVESSELSSRLQQQASEIRLRMKKKGRRIRNFFIFIIILGALAAAAVIYREHVPFLKEHLDPLFSKKTAVDPKANDESGSDSDVKSTESERAE